MVHEIEGLHRDFESLRHLIELHRQEAMVAIVSAQLTALSIVYLVSYAMHN